MDDRIVTPPPEATPRRRTIKLFGREFALPRSKALRIALGVLLVLGGIVGFLPILGFWMIPLGIVVLSYEIAHIRRLRRRMVVRFTPRQKSGSGGA
ncbi:MAG: hypothetical protein IPL47_07545 [Phyllobacteriaceae bacterium]|nr:hypothetical protein [Phyllobacteriaceae bacterium]